MMDGMNRKRASCLFGLVGLLLLTMLGCGRSDDWQFAGTVEATQYNLQAEVGGQVLQVKVAEGDLLRPGDLVAVLETSGMQHQVDQALAAVANAKAQLQELQKGARPEQLAQARENVRQAKAAVEGAQENLVYRQRNLQRVQELFSEGAVTQQQVDDAQAQVDAAAAQLASLEAQARAATEQLRLLENGATAEAIAAAKANVAQAEAALAAAQSQVEKAEIRALVAGRVVHRHLNPGEMAVPGSVVVTLADLNDLWVKVYLPERDLAKVKLGQKAKLKSAAYPDQTFTGKVVFIAQEAEFTPKNIATKEAKEDTVFAVKVQIKADGKLKPGMTMDVDLGQE